MLLIVEDDPHYARVLCDLSRDKGFKVLVAMTGTEALALGARVPSNGNLTRRCATRHAWLDSIKSSQAGSENEAHSGANADA